MRQNSEQMRMGATYIQQSKHRVHSLNRFALSDLKPSRTVWSRAVRETWRETSDDNVSLLAAGVAFYGFLAIVPVLGSIVLSYGLIADPATVIANVRSLMAVMPAEAAKLIGEQLLNVVTTSGGKKGLGLILALALALYGAMKGAGAVIASLNMAYDARETRSFIRLSLTSLTITAGAVVMALAVVIAVAALSHLGDLLPGAPGVIVIVGKIATYALLGVAGVTAASALYHFAPCRHLHRWVWLSPGSAVAALCWLLLTLGFGTYVANFGNYDATYGSLGAVVVLLTWLYLSAYVLVLGAELNSEFEFGSASQTIDAVASIAEPLTEPPDFSNTITTATGPSGGRSEAVGPKPHSMTREIALARVTAHAIRFATAPKVKPIPTVLATAGLSFIRSRNKSAAGLAMLAGAAAMAWLQRDRSIDAVE